MDKLVDLSVEMCIDDLANFMFLKNTNDAIIELSLGGIENNKDLFFFCLDLFCKGLVFLYGNDGKVNVDTLGEEQFNTVKRKMSLAGINTVLDFEVNPVPPLDDQLDVSSDAPPDVPPISNSLNIHELDMDSCHKNLKDYVFKLKMGPVIYKIHFELVHKV